MPQKLDRKFFLGMGIFPIIADQQFYLTLSTILIKLSMFLKAHFLLLFLFSRIKVNFSLFNLFPDIYSHNSLSGEIVLPDDSFLLLKSHFRSSFSSSSSCIFSCCHHLKYQLASPKRFLLKSLPVLVIYFCIYFTQLFLSS